MQLSATERYTLTYLAWEYVKGHTRTESELLPAYAELGPDLSLCYFRRLEGAGAIKILEINLDSATAQMRILPQILALAKRYPPPVDYEPLKTIYGQINP